MRATGSILAIGLLALAAGCAGRVGAPSESAKAELASTGALRVGAWVEQAKTSGAVQRIIDTAGLRGVQVAPAAQ